MKLGYTEFSFGYAFTENLIRSAAARPRGAPVFPNLIQEAQLGYDVRIDLPGQPVFFQYKLPELMVRRSAAEIATFDLPGMNVPFFRMPLMRRDQSDQHLLLIRLEQQFPGTVFYATPTMENRETFNIAYNVGEVHLRSIFLSPQDIGLLPDDKQHVISYQIDLDHCWLCSNPRMVSAINFSSLEINFKTVLEEKSHLILESMSARIREALIRLTSDEIRVAESDIRRRIGERTATILDRLDLDDRRRKVVEELLLSREIARVGLGLDMLIVQPDA